jgi:hypothetical protein
VNTGTGAFRVGHDGADVYANDNIDVQNNILRSKDTAAVIVGSGVTNCNIIGNIIASGHSAIRLRGSTSNRNIIIQDNNIYQHSKFRGVDTAAITFYGAKSVSVLNNIIDSSFPACFKIFAGVAAGQTDTEDCTITGNVIRQTGGGVYDWPFANDTQEDNTFNSNQYVLDDGATYGTIGNDTTNTTLAALQTVWAAEGYSANTNDNLTRMATINQAIFSDNFMDVAGIVGPLADLNKDGFFDLLDYAIFGLHWRDEGCTKPDWCGKADLNKSGDVDWPDLKIFTDHWPEGL